MSYYISKWISSPASHVSELMTERFCVFSCPCLSRFRDKTCNSWENRDSFVKHAGKYDLLSMDYEAKVLLGRYIVPILQQNLSITTPTITNL